MKKLYETVYFRVAYYYADALTSSGDNALDNTVNDEFVGWWR